MWVCVKLERACRGGALSLRLSLSLPPSIRLSLSLSLSLSPSPSLSLSPQLRSLLFPGNVCFVKCLVRRGTAGRPCLLGSRQVNAITNANGSFPTFKPRHPRAGAVSALWCTQEATSLTNTCIHTYLHAYIPNYIHPYIITHIITCIHTLSIYLFIYLSIHPSILYI